MVDHSWPLDTSTILGISYNLLLLSGLEVLNQLIPIVLIEEAWPPRVMNSVAIALYVYVSLHPP